jgi:hypothetical protein
MALLPEGRRSWLACDLPHSGSEPVTRGVSGMTEGAGFTAAAQQIAGKPAPTACGQNQERKRAHPYNLVHGFCPKGVGAGLPAICRIAAANSAHAARQV